MKPTDFSSHIFDQAAGGKKYNLPDNFFFSIFVNILARQQDLKIN